MLQVAAGGYMNISNESKQTLISDHVRKLSTWGESALGLLGVKESFAALITTRWGIHTLGMGFSIDVVVCDDEWIVRALRPGMKPHGFFFWNPKWRNVLELPAGTVARTGTAVGDRLKITPDV